jgi:uncharacterized protein YjbI with pentapeptide repeats
MTIVTSPGFEQNGRPASRTYLSLGGSHELKDGGLGYVDWFAADFGEITIENFEFVRCEFISADFRRARLINVKFRQCILTGAKLPGDDRASAVTYEECVFDLKTVPPWMDRKPTLS